LLHQFEGWPVEIGLGMRRTSELEIREGLKNRETQNKAY
jgi:hypothetical protein